MTGQAPLTETTHYQIVDKGLHWPGSRFSVRMKPEHKVSRVLERWAHADTVEGLQDSLLAAEQFHTEQLRLMGKA